MAMVDSATIEPATILDCSIQYPIFLQILRELWCDTSMQTLLQSIEFI